MASFFRWKIANKVLSVIETVAYDYKSCRSLIAPLVKVNRERTNQPQLYLSVGKLFKVIPSFSEHIVPENVLKSMKNQGLPTAEGIVDIELGLVPKSFVFTIDRHVFTRIVLLDICVEFANIARNSCLLNTIDKKNVIVNVNSPDIGSILTFEHLRALFHGNFIANIYKFLNMKAQLINSLVDSGPNYGCLIAGYSHFGVDEELERNTESHLSEVFRASLMKYEEDFLFQEEVSDCLKRMENGDSQLVALRKKLQASWFKELKGLYRRLGIDMDDFEWDSAFEKQIKSVSDELLQKGFISRLSENVIQLNINQMESPVKMNENISCSVMYNFARTVAHAVSRKQYTGFDEMYFVDRKSETEYYNYVLKLLDSLGHTWSRDLRHIAFRKIVEFDGTKNVTDSVGSILDRCKISILKELKMDITLELGDNADNVADSLGQAALIIDVMKQKRNHMYSFNWDDVLLFGGNSGISYQFYHAALLRLQEDSEIKFKYDIDLSPLSEKIALQLVQHLARFDEVIFQAYTYLEPCVIVEYIQMLCYLTGKATDVLNLDIKENRLRVIKARLLLFHATQKILYQSLNLLGIQPLEKI